MESDNTTSGTSSKARAVALLRSYIESLTVHGLTKVLTGHPMERILWLISLLTATCFIGYICNNNYQTYLKRDVRTEVGGIRLESTLDISRDEKVCFSTLLLFKQNV